VKKVNYDMYIPKLLRKIAIVQENKVDHLAKELLLEGSNGKISIREKFPLREYYKCGIRLRPLRGYSEYIKIQ